MPEAAREHTPCGSGSVRSLRCSQERRAGANQMRTRGRERVAVETPPLRHNRDFLKLWAGETVSLFGSQVSQLALPLTAALLLQANALEMGLLQAAGTAPFLLIGLLAGV